MGVAASIRTALTISFPSMSGSPRSRRIRSGRRRLYAFSPARPASAVSTWKPCADRFAFRARTIPGSSSITRIRAAVPVMPFPSSRPVLPSLEAARAA